MQITRSNPFIQKALVNSRYSFLTLEQFIIVTGYPVEQFMVDNFFHNLDKNINIYVTPSFLNYFGYSGELKTQKDLFLRTLKNNFENGSDYWIYNNNEYQEFYNQIFEVIRENFEDEKSSSEEVARTSPSGDTEALSIKAPEFPNPNNYIGVKGKNTTKHIILTVRCFKEFLMILTTSKAKSVRKFYLMLEDLINDYAKYQALYLQTDLARKDARIDALIENLDISNQKLERSTDELIKTREALEAATEDLADIEEEMNVSTEVLGRKIDNISRSLEIAVEDRVVQPVRNSKKEHFVVYSLNDSRTDHTHYVIRARLNGLTKSINTVISRHPDAEEKIHIRATPNAKAFYENVRNRIIGPAYYSNYVTLNEEWPESRFIEAIMQLYEERRNV